MAMKSTLKLIVIAAIMTGSVVYARIPPVEKQDEGEREIVTIVTENPQQSDEADELWQEYFKTHTIDIYNKAIDNVLRMKPPEFDNPFMDMFGWGSAHTNLITMLERYVEKGQPLPKVDTWPFRGSIKKYNKEMMRRVDADIKEQERVFKESMQ